MALGTSYIQGLVSGLDTNNIITQLAAIQRRPIVRMQAQRTQLEARLTAFQTLNASLSALQLSARDLADVASFVPRSASVSDAGALAASAAGSASPGSYQVVVKELASTHKIASGAVAAPNEALGYEGSFLINGKAVTLGADDTLTDLRDAINQSGAQVTATILNVGQTDSRLMLTAKSSGLENAIDLVDASATGILRDLGLLGSSISIKHAVSNGFQSDGLANPHDSFAQQTGVAPAPSGTVHIAGTAVEIDLAADSLEDIAERINAQVAGVTASVVPQEESGETLYRLRVAGSEGAPSLVDDGNVLQSLGILGADYGDQRQAARDAVATIDGIEVSRATNSFDDVVAGVSMELKTADPAKTVSVTVGLGLESVIGRVQSFVNSYNQIATMISDAQSYNSEKGTGGLLFGEASILRLEEGLHQALSSTVTASGGGYGLLSSVGITSTASGKLSLNTSSLRAALQSDPNAVARVFGLSSSATNSAVTVSGIGGKTVDSGAGGYEVSITQAATRAGGTSARLASGIETTETLTFNGSRHITLSAGMSLEQAADHLNSWFDTYGLDYSAALDEGRLSITHEAYGSSYKISIASSLDQGAGGTDLGGATAGETATYSGQDVAGTINGEACVGRGQYLRALQGNAKTSGLELRITATSSGSVGNVVVARGAASRLAEYLTAINEAGTGMMARGLVGVQEDIEAVDDDIARAEASVTEYTDRMWEKFITMESKLSAASVLEQYMTGQLAALRNSYNKD